MSTLQHYQHYNVDKFKKKLIIITIFISNIHYVVLNRGNVPYMMYVNNFISF